MKTFVSLALAAALFDATNGQITDPNDIRDLINESPLTCSSSVRFMNA